jgi:prophage DNA circulation protein
MTGDEADEVLGIVQRIGPVVLSTTITPPPAVGTALRRAVGMLVIDLNMVHLPTFAYAMAVCLDLARLGNATLLTVDRVRKAALEEKPLKLPGIMTADAIVRLTLATEARIIGEMDFRSREQVEVIATAMNEAFTQTEEVAADNLDQGTYMALIELHGAVVSHLSDRGRQLPRVISYDYHMVMPALRMAQRAYAEATRYQELITENNVVHPAFMPAEGQMLAAI